jgi:hypothetical protein
MGIVESCGVPKLFSANVHLLPSSPEEKLLERATHLRAARREILQNFSARNFSLATSTCSTNDSSTVR